MNLTGLADEYIEKNTQYIKDNWPAIEQEMLRRANACQNGCNGCGISRLLSTCYTIALRYQGTSYANSHPAVKAILGKLCDLAGIDHSMGQAYDDLYTRLRANELTNLE